MTTVRVLLLHHKLYKTPTTVKQHTLSTFNTLHVNWTCVQCVRRSVELYTTTPLTDAMVNTEFW